MAEKQISNNQLARMIKNGFDNTPTKDQFENLEKRMGNVETKLGNVEKRLTSVETKVDKVDERLKKVETVLTGAHVL